MHYCQRCEPARTLEPAAPDLAVCPRCGWAEIARRAPLYVVSGASGSGKSAIFAPLAAALPECAVFDMDWLIDPLKTSTGSVDWDGFRDAWLSVAHGLAQGHRSTVLLGPLMPDRVEISPTRRWIGPIRFAVLDCSDEQRRARLTQRPSWREHAIDEHLGFAAHLRRTISPVLDTTSDTPEQTALRVAAWVRTSAP
jgi:hypothetical protein